MNPEQPRLESWKEIAAYLQRDARTAHRWEKTEGLPVHRHTHKNRSSVYAYPAEIDAWRASRKVVPEPVVVPLWKKPAFAAAMVLSLVMAGSLVRPQEVEARQEKQTREQICEGSECNGLFLSPSGKLVRPKTAGDGTSFSPDGSKIAFTKVNDRFARGGDAEVIIADADGSNPRTIVRDAWVYAWSADGKQLLVGTLPADKPEYFTRLAWLEVASGALRPLPTVHETLDMATVSLDGKYVAFNASSGDGAQNVYVMASDGSGETIVSASAAYQEPVGWMPDGTLVYGQWGRGIITVWVVRVANGISKPVKTNLEFAKFAKILGLSRSGALFYRTTDRGSSDLFTAELDPTGKVTGRAVPVPVPSDSIGNGAHARWSPDSTKLAYLGHRETPRPMYVFSFDTRQEQRIPRVSSGEHCWSPDGSAVFFNELGTGVRLDLATGRRTPMFGDDKIRMANCQGDVVLVRVGHGVAERRMRVDSQRELYRTTADAGTTTPVLSHDGRTVAYLMPGIGSATSGQTQLRALSVGGGLVRNLVTEKAPAQFQPVWGIAWSADDRYIYYFRRANEKSPFELMRVPASGGAPESVGLSGEGIRELDMAPDGKRLVFAVVTTNQPEIWELKGFLPHK